MASFFLCAGLGLALALIMTRSSRTDAITFGLSVASASALTGCVLEVEETAPSGPPMCACDPPLRVCVFGLVPEVEHADHG